ncbi:hypothetical protein ETD96_15880 [Actinomadura geliboluensis]|uniref:VOC domain-containing protein n=2 Tax=Actinomadura geliboluensis TaxID=882440 RepID=A0A5S4H1T5_9ACTN|nr:hypothetical protein ETD96_15880 [Actinomadura geliboluensis]
MGMSEHPDGTAAAGGRPSPGQLGYVGIDSTDVGAWRRILSLLGCEVDGMGDGSVRAAVDDRPYRLSVQPSHRDDVSHLGWELADRAALHDLVDGLRRAGLDVERDAECADARGVAELFHTRDPAGTRVELYRGAERAGPDRAGLAERFVAGSLGFGHAVLVTADYEASLAFYVDHLGLRVSDRIVTGDRMDATFLRCNARHHSLALVDGSRSPGARKLHHVLLQVADLNIVGRTLDRCLDAGVAIAQSVGTHTNDLMTSFYVETPAGIQIEFGTDGRLIDESAWQVTTYSSPSIWGHRSDEGFRIG